MPVVLWTPAWKYPCLSSPRAYFLSFGSVHLVCLFVLEDNGRGWSLRGQKKKKKGMIYAKSSCSVAKDCSRVSSLSYCHKQIFIQLNLSIMFCFSHPRSTASCTHCIILLDGVLPLLLTTTNSKPETRSKILYHKARSLAI